jgi:UDP-glucose 4-epimerase
MLNLSWAKILVTGGTGSFGGALIDYLHDSGAEFIVYSRDETKQHDMYISRQDKKISYVIGDVRDKNKLIRAMRGVDYVVHAAALKHVPTGENWPEEVIKTNIIGTQNVIDAAEYCGVKSLVNLSTDKAAFPIGAYGMSKALAEKVALAHSGNTVITCLRYGNVLGSRGSIIPLFLKLIEQGKPITITNPRMTRFILTLEEAVKLSLKCLFNGKEGELFIMRPPACKVETIVDALELHFGKKLERQVIGIRPGEKMHETLLTGGEVYRATDEVKDGITYSRIPPQRDLDYYFSGEDYIEPEPFSSDKTEQLNAVQVLEKLKEAKLL